MVVCSPTGSGKTVVFELAVIRLLMNVSEQAHDLKIVYSKIYGRTSVLSFVACHKWYKFVRSRSRVRTLVDVYVFTIMQVYKY